MTIRSAGSFVAVRRPPNAAWPKFDLNLVKPSINFLSAESDAIKAEMRTRIMNQLRS
jgi:hypothetical protein